MTDRTDLTPQPTVWPECETCRIPWVLKRAIDFVSGEFRWAWFRDCKHKSPPVASSASGEVGDDR